MALLDAYLLRSAQKVFAIKVLVGSVVRGPSFKGVYLYIYTVTKDYVMCDISNLNQSQVEVLILIDFILKVIRIEGFGQKMGDLSALAVTNGPNNLFFSCVQRNCKAALMSHFQNSQNTMLRISRRYRFSSRHAYIGGHFLF